MVCPAPATASSPGSTPEAGSAVVHRPALVAVVAVRAEGRRAELRRQHHAHLDPVRGGDGDLLLQRRRRLAHRVAELHRDATALRRARRGRLPAAFRSLTSGDSAPSAPAAMRLPRRCQAPPWPTSPEREPTFSAVLSSSPTSTNNPETIRLRPRVRRSKQFITYNQPQRPHNDGRTRVGRSTPRQEELVSRSGRCTSMTFTSVRKDAPPRRGVVREAEPHLVLPAHQAEGADVDASDRRRCRSPAALVLHRPAARGAPLASRR